MTSAIAVGAVSLALLASAGCSSGTATDNSKALEGKIWKATEIAGVTTVLATKGYEATAAFASDAVSGSGTVNRFSAGYTTEAGDKITIAQPAATLMAGPPDAMAQEQAYFSALEKATRFAVTADSLTLTDDEGATLVMYVAVQPTALTGTEWQALATDNGKGGLQSLAASSEITAVFAADGSLTGNASVNRYTGAYTTSGAGQMAVEPQIMTTKMAGPEDLMAQEAAYLAALPRTATYTIEGDELWLRDADGAALAHYVAR
jgi:heat shock protein HslJ